MDSKMMDASIKEVAVKLSSKYPTPFYIMDLDAIRQRLLLFEEAWKKEFKHFKIAYSYKTNGLKAITQLLRNNGACAEVTSWTEAQWALLDGHRAEEIFFDGPFKSKEEIKQAVLAGARIQLDSFDEISDLIAIYKETGIVTRVSMTLATDYRGKKTSRFGFTSEEAAMGLEVLKKNGVTLSGLHLHVGSNINSPEFYTSALKTYAAEIMSCLDGIPCGQLGWIDIGGGYPARSIKKDIAPLKIEEYVSAVSNRFASDLNIEKSSFELVTEPGRTLVEDFGYLIASVAVKKRRGDKDIIVMDAGGNLVRTITGWFHPVDCLDKSSDVANASPTDIYGANCFETDLLCADWVGPRKLVKGDRIIIGSAGGYDIPSSNVWTRPPPMIFGKLDRAIVVLRVEQTSEDIRRLQMDLDSAPSVSL